MSNDIVLDAQKVVENVVNNNNQFQNLSVTSTDGSGAPTILKSDDITAITIDTQNSNSSDDDTESLLSSLSDHLQEQQQQLYGNTGTCSSTSTSNLMNKNCITNTSNTNDKQQNTLTVHEWNGEQYYSDLIREGLQYLKTKQQEEEETATATARTNTTGITGTSTNSSSSNSTVDIENVIMLFESPSSCTNNTTFFNGQTFKFHDYPPSDSIYKSLLAPCRYTMMNGSSYKSFLQCSVPPTGLIEHWNTYIPNFKQPKFTSSIQSTDTVYAYLPVEHIQKHVNDPHTHYHVCGKDVLHLMTTKTPKMLTNTKDVRPCICKTTHSMGSKGIFIINNDIDEQQFQEFLITSGNPTFVITEFINIHRNVACHFFIHPNKKDIIWIGCNENKRIVNTTADASVSWSTDSTICINDQEELKQIQLPFVYDVVTYCNSIGYWGFCGIDVLFDNQNIGYLVDVNPRCTGSSPSILCLYKLYKQFRYTNCLYRRSSKYIYNGTSIQLLKDVNKYNTSNKNKSIIILSSFSDYTIPITNDKGEQQQQQHPCTLVQLGVYGSISLQECETVLNTITILKSSLSLQV